MTSDVEPALLQERWYVPPHTACRYAVYLNGNGGYAVIAVHAIAASDQWTSILGSLVDHSGHYGPAEYYRMSGLYSFAPTHERAFQLAKEATRADQG